MLKKEILILSKRAEEEYCISRDNTGIGLGKANRVFLRLMGGKPI